MKPVRGERAVGVALALLVGGLVNCKSSSDDGNDVSCSSIVPDASFDQDAGVCYPDNDGITGGEYTIDLEVNDTGFFATSDDAGTKSIIATQNDAEVTLTLTNTGTVPHGFEVACINVCSVYPTLPEGCSPMACFPSSSTIAPIQPHTSVTITFATPTPDGLLYPFKSSAAGDANVADLNDGQWSLM